MKKELRLSRKEVLIFFEQMSFLLKTFLQVQDCLEVLSGIAEGKVRTLCLRLKEELCKGESFSEAVKVFEKSSGESLMSLLKVGEESGRLHGIHRQRTVRQSGFSLYARRGGGGHSHQCGSAEAVEDGPGQGH